MSKTLEERKKAELEWIQWDEKPTEYKSQYEHKTFSKRIINRSIENPFVPIGLTATICALCYGIWSFYKGDQMMSQYMMRARVGFQAFTLVALTVGTIFTAKKAEKEKKQQEE